MQCSENIFALEKNPLDGNKGVVEKRPTARYELMFFRSGGHCIPQKGASSSSRTS
jgi:hypothetical protein